MCAGLQSYQIFSQISQKYFLAQKNILSKKWPPKQNLKGVSKSYIGLCNHSGPFHKVTWWCMVVREVPKALLKMASGLISPSGHRGQLCITATCSTQLCSAAVGTSGTGAMRSVIGNVPIFTPSRTLQSSRSKGGQIHKVGSGPPDQYCRIANLRLKTWIGKGSSNPPHCTLLCKPQLFT